MVQPLALQLQLDKQLEGRRNVETAQSPQAN